MSRFHPRRRRGAQAIELALISPAMFTLVIGTLELGWYAHLDTRLDAVARDAVRRAAMTVDTSDEELSAQVQDEVDATLGDNGFTAEVETISVDGVDSLRVTITRDYQGITGFVPLPLSLSSTTSLRRETQL
jgi:Flp pilus assembly protein TadG